MAKKKKKNLREKGKKSVKLSKIKKIKTKEKFVPRLLRGMKDILPAESKTWDFVLEKLEKLARSYGFEKIETPTLEEAMLFKRSIGMTTNIVEKEMFTFVDKGGREVALLPEGTAAIARAYLEHGMSNLPQPVKLYYAGPMFRYEKPQAGRQREFHQFGLEVLGAANPIVETQIILFTWSFFQELKLENELQINSIGCPECRKEYQKRLFEFFRYKRKILCPTCRVRLEKNPLRIFDCKEKKCQEIFVSLPHLIDFLCEDCKSHFIKVLENLEELEISYNLNSHLVRGLDYYTKTVFEFWPQRVDLAEEERAKLALAAGGRYDGLIKLLGGRETPACGIAFGLERIIEEIRLQKIKLPREKKPQIFLAHIGETAKRKALKIFENLRKEGFLIKESLARDSLKDQLELANKLGVKLVLILGQEEIVQKTIIIKNMQTGIQEIVDLDKIVTEIRKRL